MSFTIYYDYIFVISTLPTQTLIRRQIDLEFHYFYMEITWKYIVYSDNWERSIVVPHELEHLDTET